MSASAFFALTLSLRHRTQFQSGKAPETSGTERCLIMFLIQSSKWNRQCYSEKKGGGGAALKLSTYYIFLNKECKTKNHLNTINVFFITVI